uniref:Uncharacterized protein n=1 Tax=Manihot esculenta TaxID=3983 RepID=A0A2C9UPF6_MANES
MTNQNLLLKQAQCLANAMADRQVTERQQALFMGILWLAFALYLLF